MLTSSRKRLQYMLGKFSLFFFHFIRFISAFFLDRSIITCWYGIEHFPTLIFLRFCFVFRSHTHSMEESVEEGLREIQPIQFIWKCPFFHFNIYQFSAEITIFRLQHSSLCVMKNRFDRKKHAAAAKKNGEDGGEAEKTSKRWTLNSNRNWEVFFYVSPLWMKSVGYYSTSKKT